MLIRFTILLVTSIIVTTCFAQEDIVLMNDGSKQSGNVVGFLDGKFSFLSSSSGRRITLLATDVKSIEFDTESTIGKSDKETKANSTKIDKDLAVLIAGKQGKFFNPDNQAFGTELFSPKQAAHNKLLSIRVAEIGLKKPSVKDMFDRVKIMPDDYLVIKLRIRNNQERKIMRYIPPSIFGLDHALLKDDAGNEIRPIDISPPVERVVGALSGEEDINPGETAEHLLAYRVPPPKTEFLVLSYDLSAFGGEGIVRFTFVPKLDYSK